MLAPATEMTMKRTVAEFSIEYLQFLDAHGNLVSPLPEALNNKQVWLSWYRTMILCRTMDNKAIALQRTGKMGTYPSIYGQEAISVGLGAAMHPEDLLCPYYREIGAQLQRGVKLEDIFMYWGGDERGNQFQESHDMPFCVPIASQCLHAAGAAFAFQYRKQPRVAVGVVGDGGTSKGDFYEAINLAGIWRLPAVFLVNNNQWAISVPRSAQTATETIAQKAIAAGFTGIQVDGNDIFAVVAACQQALAHARSGQGPMLIEALTYRLCDHTTADDARRYRPNAEFEEAKLKEPLIRFTQFLKSNDVLTDNIIEEIQANCSQAVEAAMEIYMNTPAQAPESMFDFMYETWPAALAEQRQDLLEAING